MDDETAEFGIDGGLPQLYFNAAGAMYAYAAMQLAALGVDVVTHSQLIGSPKIPEFGITAQQFPSASILDWRTGYGTAKYWVTKLLIDNFAPGDEFIAVKVRDRMWALTAWCVEVSRGAPRWRPCMNCRTVPYSHPNLSRTAFRSQIKPIPTPPAPAPEREAQKSTRGCLHPRSQGG